MAQLSSKQSSSDLASWDLKSGMLLWLVTEKEVRVSKASARHCCSAEEWPQKKWLGAADSQQENTELKSCNRRKKRKSTNNLNEIENEFLSITAK